MRWMAVSCAALACGMGCGGEEFTAAEDGSDASTDVRSDVPAVEGGADGSSGTGGSSGSGGTSGAGGTSGFGGTSGDAGNDVTDGQSEDGSSGSGGIGGSSGSSGSGGSSGASGSSGVGGSAGFSGSSGAGGSSGSGGSIDAGGDADASDAADAKPDVDPCANGGITTTSATADCGPAPATGLWICYVLEHEPSCGSVGLAGGNPPQSQPINPYWNDPMVVIDGNCVAPTSSQSRVLCQLPAPSGSLVQFTAGLHAEKTTPTIPGAYACDASSCKGRARVYKNGAEIGGMQNSAGYGVIGLSAHFTSPGQLDLYFTAP